MLYQLNNENKTQIQQVTISNLANHGFSEKDLENIISENISKIIPENQLMVLYQEKPFNEAADIFALDKEGCLYIFELKRWQGRQENILQVLRYGQIYGQYSYEKLNDLLNKYIRNENNVELNQKHFEYFEEELDNKLEKHKFNQNQRFVVMTNGIDANTLNAIKYWKEKGLKLDSFSYNVYSINNQPFIEFNTYNPEGEILIEQEEGCFIVNTNKTWMKDAYKDMLKNEKVAAYYGRKWSIMNIKKGDTVFLYHTGVGIIACGKAQDNYKIKEIDNQRDEEFFIPLKFDWKVDPYNERGKAVHAWQINQELGAGYRFRQTVFSIPKKMANVINKLQKLKN